MKSVELNLIPIFVAIMEERNLSRAAERLGISQPAVSKALKRLRDIYNDPIVNRNASGVEPTPFSLDIYPAMSAALTNFNSTLSSSRNFDPMTAHRVFTIAAINAVSYSFIPDLIEFLQKSAPNISLEVHPLFTEDLESDLRMQRYDLVIGKPVNNISIRSEFLFPAELVVICSKDHPRLNDGNITKEQFLTEEHLVVSAWESRKSILDSEDIDELNKRNAVHRVAGPIELMSIVGRTELIALSTKEMAELFSEQFNVRAIDSPFKESTVDIHMMWHPSRNTEPSHLWFRNEIKKLASK
ncbi:LysR family transcriptional regulator [Vibrio sp. HN007]|uniref:LysR family transcriptional regulator n=1 Tax=Vibrio iocasae TaxID=3098914 RepID=UPI0035D44F0F